MKKILFAFLLLVLPVVSFAHVGYVVDQKSFDEAKGADFQFLASAMEDPMNVELILITILAVLVVYYLGHKNFFLKKELNHIKKYASSYEDLVPWILRLSLGIALIGASSANMLVSPLLSTNGTIALIELILGFLMLFGAFIEVTALITVLLFIVGIFAEPYLFGNLEFFGAALALMLIGNPRPGFDHIVGIKMVVSEKLRKLYIPILRISIGLALTFLAVYEKILNPHASELVVQKYNLTSAIAVSPEMWVFSVGIIELVVGLFLLIGFKTRLTSAIAFAVLVVTFFYFKEDIFSHVTLFGSLSVLFITGGGIWSVDRYLEKKVVNIKN